MNDTAQSFTFAYQNWVARNDAEQPLPGLRLTNNQLFFVAFAQMWCELTTPEMDRYMLLTNDHSPDKYSLNYGRQRHFGIYSKLKNIIDADSDDENEMNNVAPVFTSSEMRNIMKSANGPVVDTRDLNLVFGHRKATSNKRFLYSPPPKYTLELSTSIIYVILSTFLPVRGASLTSKVPEQNRGDYVSVA
ncbi:hypothetical protein TNCV_3947991 [Trichonephila clavipes]|nr:hypothetical protein TNCV_3947991 [Trichonephila clavipes]